jgi:hypothetical protein
MYVYMYMYIYICKGWAKVHQALALRPSRSIVLQLLIYSFINPTPLTKSSPFLMGASW